MTWAEDLSKISDQIRSDIISGKLKHKTLPTTQFLIAGYYTDTERERLK